MQTHTTPTLTRYAVLLLVLAGCAATPRCGGPNRQDPEPAGCSDDSGVCAGNDPATPPIGTPTPAVLPIDAPMSDTPATK